MSSKWKGASNVTGEQCGRWISYANIDAQIKKLKGYANFSIGSGSCAWDTTDILTLGGTKILTTFIPTDTAVGAFLDACTWTNGGLTHAWTCSQTNAANSLNSQDPAKKFPLTQSSTCQQLASTLNAVQNEQVTVGSTQASGYQAKLATYVSNIQAMQLQKNCAQLLKDAQLADARTQQGLSAQAALNLLNKNQTITTTATSPVTVGLIVAGIVLAGIVFIVFRNKAATPAAVVAK